MTNLMNSILISDTDDVATAIVDLFPGDIARYLAQGTIVENVITEAIPRYHKFAVREIQKDALVRKYGEVIGQAVQDIGKGAHVHTHNIVSPGR